MIEYMSEVLEEVTVLVIRILKRCKEIHKMRPYP